MREIAPGSPVIRRVQIGAAVITGLGLILLLPLAVTGPPHSAAAGRGYAYAAVLFLIGGGGSIYLWLFRRNVRLLIGSGVVGYQGLLSRRRLWPRGEIESAVDVVYTGGSQPRHNLFLLTADGKRALALSFSAWDPHDLDDFVQAAAVSADRRSHAMTVKEARRKYPSAFSRTEVYYVAMTIAVMILGIGLPIGIYWAWTRLSGT